MINYEEKFKEKGLTPLGCIENHKQKVSCVDKEGYKYFLSYRGAVSDPRTQHFDKWSKNNPFKPYNMRLYANKVQENVQIVSTDEELMESTERKVKFICPNCGELYEKKWCHWIGQPDNKHFCRKCSNKKAIENRGYSYEEVKEMYAKRGFKLLVSPDDLDYQKGYARLKCSDSEGYKYTINFNSLRNGTKGENKFSYTNPYGIENLQKACDDKQLDVQILQRFSFKKKRYFKTQYEVRCSCGNIFKVEPHEILSLGRTRCSVCTRTESRYELATREWLEQNNISFQAQYRFLDCRNKKPLPFDFKCDWDNKIILIEVDGGQHYYVTQWTDEETLKEQKIRDKIKDDYAKSHGYVLLRIPYWLYDTGSYIYKLEETFNLVNNG